MARAAHVEVEGLYKIFGPDPEKGLAQLRAGTPKDKLFGEGFTVAVDDASFEVEPGEIFVVMGLSGSGKSTLLRLVNRLIEPTAGTVRIDGDDITAMSPKELIALRRARMAMVFQSFALMPHRKVLDNVAFGLEVSGVGRKQRLSRAEEALAEVGLQEHADVLPSQLSGGMQQRVGLARALATDPELLLMDEAFSALDPLIRAQMQDQLRDLQGHHPRTVLFISHDLDEAMRIGDRISIVQAGRIVQIGTPEEILQNPENAFVKAFFEGVDALKIFHAADLVDKEACPVLMDMQHAEALERRGLVYAHVTDRQGEVRRAADPQRASKRSRCSRPRCPCETSFRR